MRSATPSSSSSSHEISSTPTPRSQAARIWRRPPRPRRRRGRASAARPAERPGPRCELARRAPPSAGCRPRAPPNGDVGAGGAHVEALHHASAAPAQRAAVEQAEAAKALEPVEHQVLGQAHAGDAADRVPVFGHDADAGGGERLRRGARSSSRRATKKRPSLAGVMPDSTAAELALAVALDAGDADDLAAVDDQREAFASRVTPCASRTVRPSTCSVIVGRARRLVSGAATRRPSSSSARRPRRAWRSAPAPRPSRSRWIIARTRRSISCAGVDRLRDHAAAAQHRDAVRHLLDLGQLVRHQHHAAAARGDALADREQALDLGGQQHRGRLVEHQQPRLAHQALDDLDALALADRQVLDARRRVEREAVLAATARSTRSRAVPAAQHARATGRASGCRPRVMSGTRLKCWCTMAMPCGQRLRRPARPMRLAVAAASRRRRAGARRRRGCTASTCRRRSRRAGSGSRRRRCRATRPSSACRLPKRLPTPRSDSSGVAEPTRRRRCTGRGAVSTSKAFSLRAS